MVLLAELKMKLADESPEQDPTDMGWQPIVFKQLSLSGEPRFFIEEDVGTVDSVKVSPSHCWNGSDALHLAATQRRFFGGGAASSKRAYGQCRE